MCSEKNGVEVCQN